MEEKIVEVRGNELWHRARSYIVHRMCSKVHSSGERRYGEMKLKYGFKLSAARIEQDGIVLYPHVCDECGAEESFPCVYPKVEHESVPMLTPPVSESFIVPEVVGLKDQNGPTLAKKEEPKEVLPQETRVTWQFPNGSVEMDGEHGLMTHVNVEYSDPLGGDHKREFPLLGHKVKLSDPKKVYEVIEVLDNGGGSVGLVLKEV